MRINRLCERCEVIGESIGRGCAYLALSFCAVAMLAALPASSIAAETAQTYPSKPIVLFFPFAAGGSIDVGIRIIAAEVSTILGQPIVVQSKPGGNGMIAMGVLKQARGEPYTLVITNNGTLVTTPLSSSDKLEVGKDYMPVNKILGTNLMIAANPSAPFHDLRGMIDYAKANPGKLDIAVVGTGSNTHLAVELLKQNAGIQLNNIPYKGEAQAVPDLIGGTVTTGMLGAATKPYIESGRLIGLATTGPTRWSTFPNLPTVMELGFPDYVVVGWFGILAPPDTPPDIIAKLARAFNTASQMPIVKKKVEDLGLDVLQSTPEQFTAYINAETARWAPIIQKAGIRTN